MNNELFISGLEKLNITLTDDQISKINKYVNEINLFNPTFKLVGVENEDELIIKHVFDSLSGVNLIEKELNEDSVIADLGSGAGLPGIILAIAFPNNKVKLVERMKRRVDFLNNVKLVCKLSNVEIISTDIKDVKQKFDIITMRAFHPLYDIINDVDKILSTSGKIFAYKGQRKTTNEELVKTNQVANKTWKAEIIDLDVPYMKEERVMCTLEREIK